MSEEESYKGGKGTDQQDYQKLLWQHAAMKGWVTEHCKDILENPDIDNSVKDMAVNIVAAFGVRPPKKEPTTDILAQIALQDINEHPGNYDKIGLEENPQLFGLLDAMQQRVHEKVHAPPVPQEEVKNALHDIANRVTERMNEVSPLQSEPAKSGV